MAATPSTRRNGLTPAALALAAAAMFAVASLASGQSVEIDLSSEVDNDAMNGFLKLSVNVVPSANPGQLDVILSVVNNIPIIGVNLFFSSTANPLVPDVTILDVTGPATIFGGIILPVPGTAIGGTQITSINPPPPILFPASCTTEADCNSTPFQEFATFRVVAPPTGEVTVFGPGGDEGNLPLFDVPEDIVVDNGDIVMESDPHFSGLLHQEFDFTGLPGKVYSIISDRGFALNAAFGVAWATGLTTDEDSLISTNMYAHGTWVRTLGILIYDHNIAIDCEESTAASTVCPQDSSMASVCFMGGSVQVDGNEIVKLGRLIVDETTDLTVTLHNSRSFSRVFISSPALSANVDYVPPPRSWKIPAIEASNYAHLNLQIQSVMLTDIAHGILGQTAQESKRGLVSKDPNGAGVIDGIPADYELSHIFSTDFKYSSF